MSEYKTGILAWNPENKRFGMLAMDLWKIDGFHCGDCFEVWDNEEEKWISTRIEKHCDESYPLYRGWYLYKTNFKGVDLEGLRIRIEDY